MYVALSDLLICPRCGPTYGLILLPESIRDRRVAEGVLGCANCRERYRVVSGLADLRVPGVGVEGGPGSWSGGEAEDPAVRLAALMGLAEARGTVLVAGPASRLAGTLADLVEEIEIIAVSGEADVAKAAEESVTGRAVSRMLVSGTFPVRTGSMRAVALTGVWSGRVDEGVRVLAPLGHLVLDPAPSGARGQVEAAGLEVVLDESRVLVAARRA